MAAAVPSGGHQDSHHRGQRHRHCLRRRRGVRRARPIAKKSRTKNIAGSVYTARVESYTHGGVYTILVSKEFLTKDDKVLIIDDFLANGNALLGLMSLVEQAGAELVGAGVAIEKAYQPGGARVREKGVRVEALARIEAMSPDEGIRFC